MTREVRVGVLASGRGSNFEALLRASTPTPTANAPAMVPSMKFPEVGLRVVCLGTDNPEAPALQIATRHGIPTRVVRETARRGRLQHSNEKALRDFMNENDVELVCLAGFMRIIRGPLLERYSAAILNIHPSLLPSFPGLHAPQQALEYGVRVSGCTVHYVDSGIDTGRILLQAAVPVLDGDTVATLTDRIQQEEHRIYPQAVALWASGHLPLEDGRASILHTPTATKGTPQTAGREESA